MNDSTIKKSVISGAIWKFGERIIAQAVSLIVSIIIARLLDPSDFGVVAIVTVFFTFANVIISGGLNTALIQKKEADKEDYNTVFTISIILAFFLYFLLFLFAPLIAKIYKQSILIHVIRILGLSLPIYALKSIVCAYVSANLQFKKFFVSTLGGTLISAAIGIFMALRGFGVWALVAQQLSNTAIDTLILFITTKLKLSIGFSLARAKQLIKYGSKIFMASLLGVIMNQINPLFIGLKYTSADLSYYTKGRSFPETISTSITYTISSVLFPALSKYQNDRELLLKYTRMYMKLASFVIFPIMIGFAGVSENFILSLLGEKWLSSVFYIQIACFALMFDVIAAGNCETIKAMGRSDVFLKIEIAKKAGYFLTLMLFLIFSDSPQMLAISLLVCTLIQITINSIPNIKLIGYKVSYQAFDILPNLILSFVMYAFVILVGRLSLDPLFELVVQIISGCALYILLSILFKNSAMSILFQTLKNKFKK